MGHSGVSSLRISHWIGNDEQPAWKYYIAPPRSEPVAAKMDFDGAVIACSLRKSKCLWTVVLESGGTANARD